MSYHTEANKTLVTRLVEQVLNNGELDLIDQVYAPELAADARTWISSFRTSFPDVHMTVIDLIAEADTVIGRFTCSATHQGTWLGHPPTGRRFTDIDEVNLYRIHNGKITDTWTLEDNLQRLIQLGLLTTPPGHH
jgi:predicted ester cyclase